MKNWTLVFFLAFILSPNLKSQDYGGMYFGPKGGLGIAVQNWDGYQRNPLIVSHFALYTESLDPDFSGSLYAQIGYHTRGSAIRAFSFNGVSFSRGFRFNNIALQLGLKKRFDRAGRWIPYYNVGVRAEYTVKTNLKRFENSFNLFYPFEVYVNKFNYGISFGGGFEYESSEFVIPYFELSVHPDLSLQYRSPALQGGTNPWTGQPSTVGERRVRNITLELSIGFKFLKKVTYID